MARFILKGDFENYRLKSLPIRRGCTAICACLGVCLRVVGYIDRQEYEAILEIPNHEQLLKEKFEQCERVTSEIGTKRNVQDGPKD